MGTAYRLAVCISFAMAVANFVVKALTFGSDLVLQANVKRQVLYAVTAAGEESVNSDLDALKKESTPILEPPNIAVTVVTHADEVDGAPDAGASSGREV